MSLFVKTRLVSVFANDDPPTILRSESTLSEVPNFKVSVSICFHHFDFGIAAIPSHNPRPAASDGYAPWRNCSMAALPCTFSPKQRGKVVGLCGARVYQAPWHGHDMMWWDGGTVGCWDGNSGVETCERCNKWISQNHWRLGFQQMTQGVVG